MTDPNAPTHSIQPGFVSNESTIPEPFVGNPADGTNPVTKMVASTTGQGILFHTSSSEPVTVWLPTDESLGQYWRISFQPEPGKEFRGRNIDVMERENGNVDLLFLVSEFVDGTYLRRRLFVANDVAPLNDPDYWMALCTEPMQEIPLPEDFQAEWVKWSVKVEQGVQRAFMLNGTPSESSAGHWYWGGPYGASGAYELTNIDSTVLDAHIVTPGALEGPTPELGISEGFYTATIRGGTDSRLIWFHSLLLDPSGSDPVQFHRRPIYGPVSSSYFWPVLADLIVDTDQATLAANGTTLMVTIGKAVLGNAASYQIDPDIQVSKGAAPPFTQPGQWNSVLSEVVEGVRFGAYVTSGEGTERVEWLFDTAIDLNTGNRVLRQRRRATGETYATPSVLIDDIRADDDWATHVCSGPAMAADTVQLVTTGADGAMTLHVHDNDSGQWQQRDIVGTSYHPVVYIEARTEFMPNHLPGRRDTHDGNFITTRMVPSTTGQSIIFHSTSEKPVTVWLPTNKTLGNYSHVVFRPEEDEDKEFHGQDIDVIARENGNVDMIFLVNEIYRGYFTRQRLFVVNDFKPIVDPEAWLLLFDIQRKEIPLPTDTFNKYVKWSVRVDDGQKRSFLLNGTPYTGPFWRWCGPHGAGQDYTFAEMDSVIDHDHIVTPGALSILQPAEQGFYVAKKLGNNQERVDFYAVWPNEDDPHSAPFTTTRRLVHGPEGGLWPPINDLIVDTDSARVQDKGTTLMVTTLVDGDLAGAVYEVSPYQQLVEAAPPPITNPEDRIPGVREIAQGVRFGSFLVSGEGEDRVEWLFDTALIEGSDELVLRLRSRIAGDAVATPYLITGGVSPNDDWSTCVCTDPDLGTDVVDLVVTDRDGSVTLYFQDSISTMWQQRALIESDLTDQVEIQSYSTNINVYDGTWAPLGAHRLAITSEYPTSIFVNGRSFHTSSVLPVEVSTSAQGTLEIISPVQHLGAPKFTLHPVTEDALERANSGDLADLAVAVVPDFEEFAVDPNQVLIDRMKQYDTGAKISDARKYNGEPLFPNGPPSEETCNAAANNLQDLVDAYEGLASIDPAVLAWDHRRPYPEPVPVVSRTIYRLDADGNWTFSEHDGSEPVTLGGQPLAAFAGVGDGTIWSSLGDVFNYLWEGIKQGIKIVDFAFEKVGGKVVGLLVKIGKLTYRAALNFASAIADAADWVLQHTLGISLEDLRQWLGFIFAWDDILANHGAMKDLIHLFAEKTKTLAIEIGDNYTTKAKDAKDMIFALPTPPSDGEAGKVLNHNASHGMKDDTAGGKASRAPNAQFGSGKVVHYGSSGGFEEQTLPFSAHVLSNLVQTLESEAGTVLDHLADFDASKFGSQDIGTTMGSIVTFIESELFGVGEKIGKDMLGIAGDMINALVQFGDKRIDIPVLTPLYEKVIAPGDTLSVLDLLCLVASIGGTIICKLSTGEDLLTQAQRDDITNAENLQQWIDTLPGATSAAANEDHPVPEGIKVVVRLQFLFGAMSMLGAICYALNYYRRATIPVGETYVPVKIFSFLGGLMSVYGSITFGISYIVLRNLGLAETTKLTTAFGFLYYLKFCVGVTDFFSGASNYISGPRGPSEQAMLDYAWITEQIASMLDFALDVVILAYMHEEDVPEGTPPGGFRTIQMTAAINQFFLSIAGCLTAPIKLTVGTPNQLLCFLRASLNILRAFFTLLVVAAQNSAVSEDHWVPGYLAD